jgi:membrane protein involved in colicin uptake
MSCRPVALALALAVGVIAAVPALAQEPTSERGFADLSSLTPEQLRTYAGAVRSAVNRHIVRSDVEGVPYSSCEIEVVLSPDGVIVSRRLLRYTGSTAWVDAALRAVDKTGSLPKDQDGKVPQKMILSLHSGP